jgi:amino acid permease
MTKCFINFFDDEKFGFIYVFNLIVGTGALTMPKAFQGAGWLLSTILIVFLSVLSYITGTFMIEAMSIANCIKNLSKDTEVCLIDLRLIPI